MTKNEAIKKVREYYGNLKDLKNFQDDKDVVMAAVETDGWALQYATKRLKADRDIVTVAVKRFSESLYLASVELKKDEDLLKIYISGVLNKGYNSLEDAIQNDEFEYFDLDLVKNVYKKMNGE